jgi:hypothetical protein
MIYLPGSCERCPNISLISSEDCIGGQALCGACGGLVSVLPGCAYPEGDVSLFNELCSVLGSASLIGSEAEQLALALEEASLTLGDEQVLALAAFWAPPLAPLLPLLAAVPARARQACSMLQVILHARALTRASGVSARANPYASATKTRHVK